MGTRPSVSAPILSWLLDAKRDASDHGLGRLITNAREFQRRLCVTRRLSRTGRQNFGVEKAAYFPHPRLRFFSNACLNLDRAFETF
jgi:hypothetical protein